MSLGFKQAGFNVAAAIDASAINTEVHEKNFPETKSICADVRQLTGATIRKRANLSTADLDVVFGGPPCQGFSVGGKQRVGDPRNELLLEFARLVCELRPKYFVMENVAGLLAPRYAPLIRKFKRVLQDGGYSILEPIRCLDASDFGIPQRRKRVFVLGWRKNQQPVSYPEATKVKVVVGAAIDDLKVANRARLVDGDAYAGRLGPASTYSLALRSGPSRTAPRPITGFARTEHSPKVIKRFQRVKPGGHDAISRFIRLDRNAVAPTLRAGTGPQNGRFMAPRPIHPDYPRCITVREAARLHSFPDWFVFHPTKWNGFMQIGNSVPPALAKAVASAVMWTLRSEQSGKGSKSGDHIAANGNSQVSQHGTRTFRSVDRSRSRSPVSPSEPRPSRVARSGESV